MTYRITGALAATACAVSLLAGAPAMAQNKVEAKISSTAGPDTINTAEMNMMAKLVDLYTKGSVEGKVFTLAQLGKERAQLEGLVLGTHDIFVHISAITGKFPGVRFWDLPFLFTDTDQVYRLINSEIVKDWEDHMAKENIVYLGTWGYGYREFSIRNKPYVTPADVVGQKHRIPGGKSKQMVFEALGANVSTVAFAELYQALSQGVVDSQDNPIDQIYSMKFHEVTDYISMIHYMYNPLIAIAGKPFWDKLSPDQQAAFKRAGRDIEGWSLNLANWRAAEAVGKIQADKPSIKVNYLDPKTLPQWREKAKSVYAAFEEETSKEYLAAIRATADGSGYYKAGILK
ncbi:MAG: TRAP transporter substrate-binding protein [Alphaproteobacteria bacterium]